MSGTSFEYEVEYAASNELKYLTVAARDISQAFRAADVKLALRHGRNTYEILGVQRKTHPVSTFPCKDFDFGHETTDTPAVVAEIARLMVSTPAFDAVIYSNETDVFFRAMLCLSDQGFEVASELNEIFERQCESSLPFQLQIDIEDETRPAISFVKALNTIAWTLHGQWRIAVYDDRLCLDPDWNYKSQDLDKDANFGGSASAYCFLLAVDALSRITDDANELLVITAEQIRQPFSEANSNASGRRP